MLSISSALFAFSHLNWNLHAIEAYSGEQLPPSHPPFGAQKCNRKNTNTANSIFGFIKIRVKMFA